MSHSPVYREDSPFQDECTCGWRAYGARDRYEGYQDLNRHLDRERDKERAQAAAEKERIRLLTQGQNWDLP
ncbi:hypothetical protein [Glutamicibacter ardleyensis]|uniref:Uncharacterized protein n=1 Tax=Glutamicibacter ardleyensis TaxID=225894 RepID=A0ABQ2DJK3_9MICC|nr:hypothetical protein [Glutamicibacter ardleyensis]GGJ55839.1 hypothetical protein GCM10007173_13350 [Glutamicibacter ardleyensis]